MLAYVGLLYMMIAYITWI